MKMSSPVAPRFAAASALALLLSTVAPFTHAANLTWATSAAGTWNTSTTTAWNPGPVAWSSSTSTTDVAVFDGTTNYTVTLAPSTDIYLGGITTSATLGGVIIQTALGSSLNLTGATPTFTLNNNAGGMDIYAVTKGSTGLTKAGAGTLSLYAANTYTGGTTINAGQITVRVNNAIHTSNALTMNAGFLSLAGFNQTVASLTGASGATVRATAGTATLTVDGASSTTFAGSLSDGAAALRLNLTVAGGTLALTGTSKAYRGATTISGGTLNLGTSLATGSVDVSVGTLTSSVASVTLGTGAVSMSSGFITPGGVGTVGSFTLAANQTFTTTGGTLNFNIGGTFDQIIGSGTGAFSLTNTTLALNDGVTSVAGSYLLFSGFGGTNTVSGLIITGLDPGFSGVLGANGVLTVSAIPEPSTWAALFGAAALGIAVLRRRNIARA